MPEPGVPRTAPASARSVALRPKLAGGVLGDVTNAAPISGRIARAALATPASMAVAISLWCACADASRKCHTAARHHCTQIMPLGGRRARLVGRAVVAPALALNSLRAEPLTCGSQSRSLRRRVSVRTFQTSARTPPRVPHRNCGDTTPDGPKYLHRDVSINTSLPRGPTPRHYGPNGRDSRTQQSKPHQRQSPNVTCRQLCYAPQLCWISGTARRRDRVGSWRRVDLAAADSA